MKLVPIKYLSCWEQIRFLFSLSEMLWLTALKEAAAHFRSAPPDFSHLQVRILLPHYRQQLHSYLKKMKTITIASAVLCCLLAVCSAQAGEKAVAQWHVRAPELGCVEVSHSVDGNHFRIYTCDNGTAGEYVAMQQL